MTENLIFLENLRPKALFSCENFLDSTIVALSFVFGKYCSIMYKLGSKDLSRNLQINCIINYFLIYI